jgi:protein NirF
MRNPIITLLILLFAATTATADEKLFVVERQDSSLAVIEGDKLTNRLTDMHNFNHAVVKFWKNEGFAITRDGFVIKFDPVGERKLKEYQTSKSAIGFIISDRFLAIANYDNKTVEILDHDLNPVQTINTGSKNVGIKTYKNYLVFALMDKDSLWVMEDTAPDKPLPVFKVAKKFENVGVAPFDAMLDGHHYIAGFFNSPYVGKIDLENMTFAKLQLQLGDKKPVLKVPHFGFWSLSGDQKFIPAVGDNKVFVFGKDFKYITSIETEGLPVFTSLSPDKRFLAVTFSGKHFPVVQIIDTRKLEVIQRFEFSGKILHVRWSEEKPLLYFSNNTDNKLVAYDTRTWKREFVVDVKHPSGIFLFTGK